MKTAISIPEEVFAEAERLARRLGKSRSQLYTDAIRQYLDTHDPEGIIERLNRLADEMTRDDGVTTEFARRVLQRVEWT